MHRITGCLHPKSIKAFFLLTKHKIKAGYLNWKISAKMIIGFVTMAVLCSVLIGIVGVVNILGINSMSNTIYKENLSPLTPLYQISTNFLTLQVKLRDFGIGKNHTTFSDITRLQEDTLNKIQVYSNTVSSDAESDSLDRLQSDIDNMNIDESEIEAELATQDYNDAYGVLYGDLSKQANNFDATINKLFALKTSQAKSRNTSNTVSFYIALIEMTGIMLLAIAISVLFGILNARIISKPIQKLVNAAEAISSGNLDVTIENTAGDETGVLSRAFAKISSSLHLLKSDVDMLIGGALDGKLDVRADILRHQGAYRAIISGVNQALDTITIPLNTAADYVDQISRGELPEPITDEYKGDFNKLRINLNTCVSSIRGLIADAQMLSDAAVQGNLSARVDANRHQGDYRRIIEGVNETLDAITGPLDTAADYVARISHGDIPEQITKEYYGDFNKLKNNLNGCCDAIHLLVKDADTLCDDAIKGDLSSRADASRHQGDFRHIIEGVNGTLDAITVPLSSAAVYIEQISRGEIPDEIVEDYRGDFNKLKDNLNICCRAIHLLIEDAGMLRYSALEGDLSARADVQKHQGAYARIIEGVNETLDAFIGPIREAGEVLDEMSKGNLKVAVRGNYRGDLAAIKISLNTTISAMSCYIGEISAVLSQIASGNLDVSMKTDFKGDFATIKTSIGDIIVALNEMIQDIRIVSEEVAAGSQQVSIGSQRLSQGAMEQAGAINQFDTAITRVAEQTQKNALIADQANEITDTVKDNAEGGDQQMTELLGAMEEIKQSSANIKKIIRAIDDIAFQTNILSLNAAVEAARAGQYGKGFAVVADEVRNLAAKSANAASETAKLIENSIQKSELGMEIATQTASTLKKIVGSVEQAADMMNVISKESNRQADKVSQASHSLNQISMVVQSNSSTAQESSASSEQLLTQSELLKKKVSRFHLKTLS